MDYFDYFEVLYVLLLHFFAVLINEFRKSRSSSNETSYIADTRNSRLMIRLLHPMISWRVDPQQCTLRLSDVNDFQRSRSALASLLFVSA
jgi:hypothetical protein